MKLDKCYEILGLPLLYNEGFQLIKASDEEIRKQYKQKCLQYHPDKNSDEDAKQNFLLVTEAYERIINPQSFVAEDYRKNNPPSSSSSPTGGTVSYSRGVQITQYSDGLREEMTTTKAGVENTNIFLHSTLIATAKKTKRSVTFENIKGGCYEMTKQMPVVYGWSIGPLGIKKPNGQGGESKASWEARQKAAETARAEASSLLSSLSDILGAFLAGKQGSSASGAAAATTSSGSGNGSASAANATSGSIGDAKQKEANNREFLKAACNGNQSGVVSLFRCQAGVDKNGQDSRGFTALYYAASSESVGREWS